MGQVDHRHQVIDFEGIVHDAPADLEYHKETIISFGTCDSSRRSQLQLENKCTEFK